MHLGKTRGRWASDPGNCLIGSVGRFQLLRVWELWQRKKTSGRVASSGGYGSFSSRRPGEEAEGTRVDPSMRSSLWPRAECSHVTWRRTGTAGTTSSRPFA